MPEQSLILLYIDPGAGFLALQILAGSVIGMSFVFRRTTRRVLKALKIIGRKDSQDTENEE